MTEFRGLLEYALEHLRTMKILHTFKNNSCPHLVAKNPKNFPKIHNLRSADLSVTYDGFMR